MLKSRRNLVEEEADDDCVVLQDEDGEDLASEYDEEEIEEEEEEEEEDNFFKIPKLPSGNILVFRILSSWNSSSSSSSSFIAGLAGIELFDQNGNRIEINPENIIPLKNTSNSKSKSSSHHQQQLLSNIVREPFDTTDKSKMWVTEYSEQQQQQSDDPHFYGFAIVLPSSSSTSNTTTHFGRSFSSFASSSSSSTSKSTTTLSVIRIWNYNSTNRSHLSRGVKNIEIFLDQTPIFMNRELRMSQGDVRNETGVETILFTDDAKVLMKIAENAEARSLRWGENGNNKDDEDHKNRNEISQISSSPSLLSSSSPIFDPSSPTSRIKSNNENSSASRRSFAVAKSIERNSSCPVGNGKSMLTGSSSNCIPVSSNIELIFADNWNEEASCLALSGIQFIDENDHVIDCESEFESVTIQEGWSSVNNIKEEKTKLLSSSSALFDNNPETSWIIQSPAALPVILKINLRQRKTQENNVTTHPPLFLSSLRIANFSGGGGSSSSSTEIGIKHFRIRIDGKEILDGMDSRCCKSSHQWLMARKAPNGSFRMEKLLFQTFRASSLLSSSSSSSSSSILSASVQTLARSAILRSRYLSRQDLSFPSWIPSSYPFLDQNVPLLPSGYTFSLGLKIIRDVSYSNSSNGFLPRKDTNVPGVGVDVDETSLEISNLILLDEEGDELEQDFVCSDPPPQQKFSSTNCLDYEGTTIVVAELSSTKTTSMSTTTIHIAFETIRTLSAFSFQMKNHHHFLTQEGASLEVTVFCNDEIIFGTLFREEKVVKNNNNIENDNKNKVVLIPFVPDENILGRFRNLF